jgi:hypothetical protein
LTFNATLVETLIFHTHSQLCCSALNLLAQIRIGTRSITYFCQEGLPSVHLHRKQAYAECMSVYTFPKIRCVADL